MYYDYQLNGNLFEDRETVQRALYSNSLSQYEKEALLKAHNDAHLDCMTEDTYMNLVRYDIDLNKYW